ncbi:carbamoyl-phosphate synthase (glutamine-hydrolyzing) large subunit [Candidatus Woesearchaeota archaeon]|nr:carbamoyl-phosphate synthase (glutamine-hydrolyzing) large subunit [Candidatus Woesearchaeota archaeon]
MDKPTKILVLGSGSIKIGEAGEFDFSGSQALKSLREEGIKTVLVNPNIATIQSDEKMADKIYFLPITPYFVEKIIAKEHPDGILLGFGGQTALNCGVVLHDSGVLAKYNVKVLGTPIETIKATEDRELFVKKLNEINLKTPRSKAVTNVNDALVAAEKIVYPIIIRSAYALGGLGSAICKNEEELEDAAKQALANAPQILVEEYLEHWKEIEYEVVRDAYDNCITVCNMENLDPMGIHTGESIVVAPSQTLTNHEYHKLREISIKLIRHLGIVGECNIQFALDQNSDEYRIIEVNARLSRSSALASKATGYPLAFVAAKLALGYSLTEIKNSITQITIACFEPALDYIVVKIPRWDLKKFRNVSRRIGSSMKSVGEVMAIGRTFEEAIQKAVRMLDIGAYGLVGNKAQAKLQGYDIKEELANPTDERLFVIVEAMKEGYGVEQIHKMTGIDEWFLHKLNNVISVGEQLTATKNLTPQLLKTAKQNGFSDRQIAKIIGSKANDVRALRKNHGIVPVVKQIDTLAAEYPAKTNYLYLTYNGNEDDITFRSSRKKIIVLGSGVYRIGSSVEFDWCCVNAVFTLRQLGYEAVMVNYNPETVSTDYDVCDKLYFDEISSETVTDIYEKEKADGVIISMGGQIPNNIALKLAELGVKILGTTPESIDKAEDRQKFSQLLDKLGIDQPRWEELTSVEDAEKFAAAAGYPVLVRPSYVLSGAAMSISFSDEDLEQYLDKASSVSEEYPVVISKFITNSKEIEIDAVAANGKIVLEAITEHIENAGVHSGDATMVFPPKKLYVETTRKISEIAAKIADALKITGPFNIQFLAKENDVKVIECNLRASRSFPFVSKVSKKNFAEIATKAVLGLESAASEKVDAAEGISYVGVKSPQFSFTRLKGADPLTSVEMASTGEVACLGTNTYDAFLKAIMAAGFKLPEKNILISIGGDEAKVKFLPYAKKLSWLGFALFATEHTELFLEKNKIPATMLHKVSEEKSPNILDYLDGKNGEKLHLVINIPTSFTKKELDDEYVIRRKAADYGIPLITNLQLARLLAEAIAAVKPEELEVKAWDEYA